MTKAIIEDLPFNKKIRSVESGGKRMSKRTVYDCDKCGKPIPLKEPITIHIPDGFQTDAAGGPSETLTKIKDLCPHCAESFINYIFHFQETTEKGTIPRLREYHYNPHYHSEYSQAAKAAKTFFHITTYHHGEEI